MLHVFVNFLSVHSFYCTQNGDLTTLDKNFTPLNVLIGLDYVLFFTFFLIALHPENLHNLIDILPIALIDMLGNPPSPVPCGCQLNIQLICTFYVLLLWLVWVTFYLWIDVFTELFRLSFYICCYHPCLFLCRFGGRQIHASEDDGLINHALVRDLDEEAEWLEKFGAEIEADWVDVNFVP